ncbi:hypothetical protein [Humisphaera borealis]|uniref:Uncharacterized protein n=1 Tax=Humisphaera borealis TaxID=2807512 RepID=A0A7M2WSL1_9BACT|nr:hypothetical protein [Humisphaera borealis]QOV88423.1 hypothetical protein IPV69_19535 [Humisphaera borealis]
MQSTSVVLRAPAPALAAGPSGDVSDDGIEVIELPDAPTAAIGGVFDLYERHGFETGRRRGFREAQALVSLAVEELIADSGMGDVPPSVLRSLAAAVSARLDRYTPSEPYLEGGLGI